MQTDAHLDEQTNAAPQPGKRPLNLKREILEWVKALLIAAIAVVLIRTFLFTMIRVDGRSMLETLHHNDRIAATIIDLKVVGPKRGDIVILKYPGSSDNVIKRVIGEPGDTIEIASGVTYLNGEPLDEPYVEHPDRDNHAPITLGEDEYYVMGDNRANSRDSRIVGPVTKDRFIAKARLRIWPIDRIGGV